MQPLRNLGDFIRDQRKVSDVSLRQLAAAAGVSNPYLSQIERGLRRPSADILQQLAKALRISSEALYVQAGMLDERVSGTEVALALQADPGLTEQQKQVLLEIYDSFRQENESPSAAPGAPPAAPPPAAPPAATPPSTPSAATRRPPAKKAAKTASPATGSPTVGPTNPTKAPRPPTATKSTAGKPTAAKASASKSSAKKAAKPARPTGPLAEVDADAAAATTARKATEPSLDPRTD